MTKTDKCSTPSRREKYSTPSRKEKSSMRSRKEASKKSSLCSKFEAFKNDENQELSKNLNEVNETSKKEENRELDKNLSEVNAASKNEENRELGKKLYEKCLQDIRKKIGCQKEEWESLKKEPEKGPDKGPDKESEKQRDLPECFKNKNRDEILCEILNTIKKMEDNFESINDTMRQINSRAETPFSAEAKPKSIEALEATDMRYSQTSLPFLEREVHELDTESCKASEVNETLEREESCKSEETASCKSGEITSEGKEKTPERQESFRPEEIASMDKDKPSEGKEKRSDKSASMGKEKTPEQQESCRSGKSASMGKDKTSEGREKRSDKSASMGKEKTPEQQESCRSGKSTSEGKDKTSEGREKRSDKSASMGKEKTPEKQESCRSGKSASEGKDKTPERQQCIGSEDIVCEETDSCGGRSVASGPLSLPSVESCKELTEPEPTEIFSSAKVSETLQLSPKPKSQSPSKVSEVKPTASEVKKASQTEISEILQVPSKSKSHSISKASEVKPTASKVEKASQTEASETLQLSPKPKSQSPSKDNGASEVKKASQTETSEVKKASQTEISEVKSTASKVEKASHTEISETLQLPPKPKSQSVSKASVKTASSKVERSSQTAALQLPSKPKSHSVSKASQVESKKASQTKDSLPHELEEVQYITIQRAENELEIPPLSQTQKDPGDDEDLKKLGVQYLSTTKDATDTPARTEEDINLEAFADTVTQTEVVSVEEPIDVVKERFISKLDEFKLKVVSNVERISKMKSKFSQTDVGINPQEKSQEHPLATSHPSTTIVSNVDNEKKL